MIRHNLGHSIEGPKSRGFSYIEIWFVGMQTPIIFAIIEYGFLMGYKKFWPKTITVDVMKDSTKKDGIYQKVTEISVSQ